MRQVVWKLKSGGKEGQETREEKYQKGQEYIERLRQEDDVIEVVEEQDRLIIYLKD